MYDRTEEIPTPTEESAHMLDDVVHPPDATLVALGYWPDGATTWGFYTARHLPKGVACAAAAGVVIRSLQPAEFVLTFNPKEKQAGRIRNWEVPAGHVDPGDPPETPQETLTREMVEEVGFQTKVDRLRLFGYRLMLNPPGSYHAEKTIMPYYYVLADPDQALIPATDPGKPIAAIYPDWSMQRLVAGNMMKPMELTIAQYGLAAARQARTA